MTNEAINILFKAVIDHQFNLKSQTNNYNINRLPTLNSDFIRLAYYEIKDKLNMTVHYLGSESHFHIYLCKFDNNVYKVITGEFPSNEKFEDNLPENVYYVSKVSPLMSW